MGVPGGVAVAILVLPLDSTAAALEVATAEQLHVHAGIVQPRLRRWLMLRESSLERPLIWPPATKEGPAWTPLCMLPFRCPWCAKSFSELRFPVVGRFVFPDQS